MMNLAMQHSPLHAVWGVSANYAEVQQVLALLKQTRVLPDGVSGALFQLDPATCAFVAPSAPAILQLNLDLAFNATGHAVEPGSVPDVTGADCNAMYLSWRHPKFN